VLSKSAPAITSGLRRLRKAFMTILPAPAHTSRAHQYFGALD
jgi:hypothetical protein